MSIKAQFAFIKILLIKIFFLLVAVSTAKAGDLKYLVDKAESGQPMSVEDFLQALPRAYKTNLLLGYAPRGLGTGTIDEPRIISYDPQGTSFIALQSSSEGERGNAIELIDFDTETNEYTFYDIHLGSAPKVIKNPSKCVGCHRGKPLWDSYPVWPGFVGSASKPMDDNGSASPLAIEYSIIEKHIIQESPNPRIAIFDVNKWDPSLKPSQLTQLYRSIFKRNANLNRRIFMLEGKRLADQLQKVPGFYEYYAPLIMLLIAGRDEFWSFYGERPKDVLIPMQERMNKNFWEYIEDVRARQLENRVSEVKNGVESPFLGFSLGFEGQVTDTALNKNSVEYYFLVNKFKINPKDLEVIFGPQVSFSFSDGANSTHEHLWAEVTRRLLVKYPEWAKVFEVFYAMDKNEAIERYGIDYPTAGIMGGLNWTSGNFGGSLARWNKVDASEETFDRARELLLEYKKCEAQFFLP